MAVFTGRPTFDPAPSIGLTEALTIVTSDAIPEAAAVVGVLSSGGSHADIGLDQRDLKAAGFEGKTGQTLVVPAAHQGPVTVLVGIGDDQIDADGLRDAAAAFARATQSHANLAMKLTDLGGMSPEAAGQALVEGVLLARYRFDALKSKQTVTPVAELALVTGAGTAEMGTGAEKGRVRARATMVARDLANTPPALLTAVRMAELAVDLGPQHGLDVEVFDKAQLSDMGCGGLLGVNAGSAEEPRMIKLSYRPANPSGHLTLVGKGIMYDAGGIALKPADEVHATMKNDMSGAGAILAAMLALQSVDCPTEVVGYLMCTDNRPSDTSIAMGDILTVRGGTTVEVVNTDAEGRLVMADALVLATESPTDAIVDIATLTGAAMRALGTQVAGLMGNDAGLVEQVRSAGAATGEPVWELPLERRYRDQLDSHIADIKNLGGANAGAITAALFLEEFVAGTPWAHIDIAGTAQTDRDASWRPPGCTGFGARLLIDLALNFTRPAA